VFVLFYTFFSILGLLGIGLFALNLPFQFLFDASRKRVFKPSWFVWAYCAILSSLLFSWFWMGRVTLGLLSVVLLPFFFKKWAQQAPKMEKFQSLQDFLSCLFSLRGLLEVGLSLPSALFQISKNFEGPLTLFFKETHREFEKGESLEQQMSRSGNRLFTEWVTLSLIIMERAHRKGLTLVSFVENLIPVIELEIRAHRRLQDLENSLKAQAILACGLPWLLGVFIYFFQPEMTHSFVGSRIGQWILIVVLGWEVLGLWFLKESIRFY